MENRKFVFVSDFDGTLTNRDFYQMIIDDYLGEEGYNLFNEWKENKYKDRDFLNEIYDSINRDEKEILKDVLRIEWDNSADGVIEKIQDAGGEFIILSAGTSYYIEKFLIGKGLSKIKVYSNLGEDKNKGIHLKVDENKPYYSDVYGIDKGKVNSYLKEKYPYVYYVGDSLSDIISCKVADECFAKGALQQMLRD